jgi:hypothetical protein
MNPLEIYPQHKAILEKLLETFDKTKKYEILDAGSGRTSLYYLAEYFPKSNITAVVFPGDQRKIKGIKDCVKNTNYQLLETDIINFNPTKKYDVTLAHLLLGEATKFSNNTFKRVVDALFSIKTRYLIIIDIKDDPEVNFDYLNDLIRSNAKVIKIVEVDKYIGFALQMNT